MNTSPTFELAPGFQFSRVLTGLWQVADLERNGTLLNPEEGALSLKEYFDAGLTCFDMADHYGSAEVIAGVFQKKYAKGKARLFTKWVPAPFVNETMIFERLRAIVAME